MVNFNYRFGEGVINQRVNINTMVVIIHQNPHPYNRFSVFREPLRMLIIARNGMGRNH